MKVLFDHKLLSSFLLFLDHVILEKGQSYTNHTGKFYPINSSYNGLYAYASSFKQLVADQSITGATQISGAYLNNNFVNIGISGLHSLNHLEGVLYFTGQLPTNTTISGQYAVKEFNTQIVDETENKLLLETKYTINSRSSQALSGLNVDVKTAPAIFLKYKSSENLPFSFGGIDDNSIKIRAILICETSFQKIGVCNIFKNLNLSGFSIYDSLPFDFRGSYTGAPYNYNNLSFDTTYTPFVKEVRIFDVPQVGEYENLPKNAAIADFEIFCAMRHNT